MALIDYVLQYAARGWYVFPLRPRSKLPLISKKAGGRGFHDATTDRKQLETWWRTVPEANIGIATGASGLVVVDVDGPEGQAALKALVGTAGIPRTLAARTGREGGLHLIYRGTGVKSTADKDAHLDVRGSTGYIVAPPSIHPSGAIYGWIDATVPAVVVPELIAVWANGSRPTPAAPLQPPTVDLKVNSGRGLAARSVANLTESPPFSEAEADRLFSALSVIDAATDYSTWIAYGAALHDLKWIVNGIDEAFEIWDEWSSTSKGDPLAAGEGGYPGRAELERKWASFNREYQGPRVTIASIYAAALAKGWQYDPTTQKVNGNHILDVFPQSFQQTFATPIIWFDRDQWGRPKTTCRNARAAIRHLGLTCEHDRFHDKLIIGGQPIAEWAGELTDNTTHMLRVTIAQRYNLDPGTTNTFDAAVQECLQDSFDPIADYLDSLVWDGVGRLRSWLAVYLGAADTTLNAAIGGLMLVAAVRRVRQPGCKFDQILVLISDEGKNKSSAIEILAGPGNFSDQTILTLDDKGQQEALSGVWLYEIADLAGMSKADTEKVKAFASRRVDRARPAYARARVDKPRRCVFFATTNHATFLKSQTGNRRFWPVEVGRIDLAMLARDRDQLWAEAAAIERRGVSLFLPEALWGDAKKLQDARQDADPWDEMLSHIKGKVDIRPDGRGYEERITTRDLLEVHLGMKAERLTEQHPRRLAYCMRRLGWHGPDVLWVDNKSTRGYRRDVKEPAQ
jgi:Virulence-associated protein E/Bifunctional DNA primase/polymerase, N-terminal/Primase C terminal 2 (PriCT-2)